jgi:hypothetical protein
MKIAEKIKSVRFVSGSRLSHDNKMQLLVQLPTAFSLRKKKKEFRQEARNVLYNNQSFLECLTAII